MRALTKTFDIGGKRARRETDARKALDLWLANYSSENTRRAYEREILAFADHIGGAALRVIAEFLALSDSAAHQAVDAWRASKIAQGLSPVSINRSMSALDSFVASARWHGLTSLRLSFGPVRGDIWGMSA